MQQAARVLSFTTKMSRQLSLYDFTVSSSADGSKKRRVERPSTESESLVVTLECENETETEVEPGLESSRPQIENAEMDRQIETSSRTPLTPEVDHNVPVQSQTDVSQVTCTSLDVALTPQCLPCQPAHLKFPVTLFSGKARAFNPAWFNQYSWLEYSAKKDAAFCYPCCMFGSISVCTTRPEPAFTSVGFRDWKHATGAKGILVRHNCCLSHKQALVAWQQYKSTSQGGSVAEQLGSTRAEQIRKNKHYIRTIVEVLLLCSRQEISIRGHRESSESTNRGNFKEILALVAKHDPVIEQKLAYGPKNAMYTSPTIQNTLLKIMGDLIRNKICDSVRKAGFYSILADETKDLRKKEQLSIAVRYVDVDSNSAKITERFLTYDEASSLNAESLSKYILDTLNLYSLDVSMMVSQGYDGASVMSGVCSGVQQRIKEIAPQALYVHCRAHCLNLVLVDCMKNNSHASQFFSLVQSLYVFLSSSKAHAIFIEKQAELHEGKQTRQLQRLSDTRWACRYLALDAIVSTFDSVLATLESIAEGNDKPKAIEATGILYQVRCFKSLSCLIIFLHLM